MNLFSSDIEKNPKFWIKEDIPENELLAHPSVKAALSNCGWTSVLNFVTHGVPVVTWPHYGDQLINS